VLRYFWCRLYLFQCFANSKICVALKLRVPIGDTIHCVHEPHQDKSLATKNILQRLCGRVGNWSLSIEVHRIYCCGGGVGIIHLDFNVLYSVDQTRFGHVKLGVYAKKISNVFLYSSSYRIIIVFLCKYLIVYLLLPTLIPLSGAKPISHNYFRQNTSVIGNVCKWSFIYSDIAHTHVAGLTCQYTYSFFFYRLWTGMTNHIKYIFPHHHHQPINVPTAGSQAPSLWVTHKENGQ
jgi:hypothetical protein